MLDLPDGARVADALAELDGLADGLPLVMAVNREYADAERALDPGRRAGPDPAGERRRDLGGARGRA